MKESKKLFITILLAAGLLTAVAATENAGRAVLGISPHEKEIIVTAVTADGSPVQVEGKRIRNSRAAKKRYLR